MTLQMLMAKGKYPKPTPVKLAVLWVAVLIALLCVWAGQSPPFAETMN
jgi:hypothetical protein